MRQPPTNICPLHGTPCTEDRCAWWDCLTGSCCMTAGSDALQIIAASLEELVSNYQAPGNLPRMEAQHGKET